MRFSQIPCVPTRFQRFQPKKWRKISKVIDPSVVSWGRKVKNRMFDILEPITAFSAYFSGFLHLSIY